PSPIQDHRPGTTGHTNFNLFRHRETLDPTPGAVEPSTQTSTEYSTDRARTRRAYRPTPRLFPVVLPGKSRFVLSLPLRVSPLSKSRSPVERSRSTSIHRQLQST